MVRFSRQKWGFVAIFSIWMFSAGPVAVWAGESKDPCFEFNYALNFLAENDIWGGGTDQHFTHGSRISFVESKKPLDAARPCAEGKGESGYLDIFRGLFQTIFDEKDPLFQTEEISFILGQSIFTPEHITRTDLIAEDRPYAGWLYVGLGLINKGKSGDWHIFDTMEIDLGIVGPQAYAGEVQRWWHEEVTDSPRPEGWQHQLRNEPGLLINLERKWRRELTRKGYEGLQVDFLPNVGVALGNVFTYGAAGGMLRIGVNIPVDYGPPRIRPGAQGSDFFQYDENNPVSWYVYGGVEGRVIGHNIFLDGNTFTDSHSVGTKLLVADVHAGLVVVIYHFRLAISQIFRTPEFEGQEEASEFGSVNISFAW